VDQKKAALEQAKAEVSVKDALWTTAKANLARVKPLAEQNAVSKKDLDDAIGSEQSTRSAVEAAKAAVDSAEANIVAAEAQVLGSQADVEKAQLNLSFAKITSPIDGIAGIAKAQIGNLVGPGSIQELTTVSDVNPIKCYISLSEQEYMKAQARRVKQQEAVSIELILSDGSTIPRKVRLPLQIGRLMCGPARSGWPLPFRTRRISSGPGCSAGSVPSWGSRRLPWSSSAGSD